MKVTEAKYSRRYNTGNYEHEEFSLTAILDESDDPLAVMAVLKNDVELAYSGEVSSGTSEDAETDTENTADQEEDKKPKQRRRRRKQEDEDESSSGDSSSEDEAGEESTDEDSSENDSEETDQSSSEEEEPVEEEVEEEEKPAKKTRSTAGSKAGAKKGFKKKPQVYQRSNETHKDIFGSVLRKVAPNWKKSFESKAHAKKVSQKMEGQDFLDEDGLVLPSFETEVKKLMKKFA